MHRYSIWNLTVKDGYDFCYELIIVDEGSTDNSWPHLHEYSINK